MQVTCFNSYYFNKSKSLFPKYKIMLLAKNTSLDYI